MEDLKNALSRDELLVLAENMKRMTEHTLHTKFSWRDTKATSDAVCACGIDDDGYTVYATVYATTYGPKPSKDLLRECKVTSSYYGETSFKVNVPPTEDEMTYHMARPIALTKDMVDGIVISAVNCYHNGVEINAGDEVALRTPLGGIDGVDDIRDVLIPDVILIDNKPCRITEIGAHAFDGMDDIDGFILPRGVKVIAKAAFRNCRLATDFYGIENAEFIDQHAFSGCESVTSLSLDSARTIRDEAFAGCTSLQAVYNTKELVELGDDVFDGDKEFTGFLRDRYPVEQIIFDDGWDYNDMRPDPDCPMPHLAILSLSPFGDCPKFNPRTVYRQLYHETAMPIIDLSRPVTPDGEPRIKAMRYQSHSER